MSRLRSGLIQLDADLRALDLRWALIGGLAVAAYSIARTTEDLDVAVAVEGDPQAEAVIADFQARGYRMMDPIEQMDTKRLATVRMLAPRRLGHPLVADLMFASSGIEAEIVAEARPLEAMDGVVVRVIQLGHLLALKVLAGRPQDVTDLQRLLVVATDEDRRIARDALELISRRGYDRGKSLQTDFTRQIRDFENAHRT